MREAFSSFLTANARWLAAGAVLTLSSAFGQTFFISIFAGEIRGEFGLSHGQWGGIYTIGTLSSAVCMFFLGGLTDRFRIKNFATVILVAMACVCLSLATVGTAWALPLVIFGLRFCGQGMLSHTAMVGLGRWFKRSRGRANAIMGIGYLSGESVLPILFVLLMGAYGWRSGWYLAAFLALLIIPVIRSLLRAERKPGGDIDVVEQTGMDNRHWTRRDALSHWLFYVAALGVASPSMLGTAYFFQQVHLTEIKGWPLAGFVALIPMFSLTSLICTFAFGAFADRFGTARVFPLAMLPAAIGFAVVSNGDTLLSAAIAFLFFGMMQGGVSTIGGAFWPEFFGTRYLGSVRAVGSSLTVFGSAIGPGITGYFIDFGVDYTVQLMWMSIYFLVLSSILWVGFTRAAKRLPAPAD